MRSSLLAVAAAAALLSACAAKAEVPVPTPAAKPVTSVITPTAVTRHVGHFNGKTVPYTATVRMHVLKDKAGKPAATMTTIAYVRSDVADPDKRPVMFVFNGGPGASTSPLHMDALGPYRWVKKDAKTAFGEGDWQANSDSPLDAVDIVFIDPAGTGFNHPIPGANPKPWYTAEGDAQAFKTLIEAWLKAHHRMASPRYLMGESYGTTRAALILKDSKDMPFNGVLLVALVGDAAGHVMPYVTSLPTMAAGAWYHRRIARAGRTPAQVYREALKFSRTDYAEALIQGSSLPAGRKHKIAKRMSKLIGLPVSLIEKDDLRISKNTYMFNLLKPQGLRTGLLDVRVTASLAPGQEGALDDPALGVVPPGKEHKPGGPPLTPMSIGAVPSPKVGAYMRKVLKFDAPGPYIGVNFLVNVAWKYGDAKSAMADLGKVMTADPKLRLFWAAGYYDLTTPAYQARYTLDQDGIPASRITTAYFAGPHSVYSGDDNRAKFTDAVRHFVTATP